MWGPWPLATSSGCFCRAGSNPLKRHIKFPPHVAKWQRQRRAPPDQDVVVAGLQGGSGRQPDDVPQPAPYPVALHRITDLLRYRETDARRLVLLAVGLTAARLHHERATGCPHATRGGKKVRPASQSLHGDLRNDGEQVPGQALSRLRPRVRRAESTLRPPFVAIRERKPWRRLRTNLLGW